MLNGRKKWESFGTIGLGACTLLVGAVLGWKQIAIADRQAQISEQQMTVIQQSSVLLHMPVPEAEVENRALVLKNVGQSPFFVVETDLPWEGAMFYKPIPVAPGGERRFEIDAPRSEWFVSEGTTSFRAEFVLLSVAQERYLVECELSRKGDESLEAELLWVVSEKAVIEDRRR